MKKTKSCTKKGKFGRCVDVYSVNQRIRWSINGPKSVSARWPPTRSPSCKLDLWARL